MGPQVKMYHGSPRYKISLKAVCNPWVSRFDHDSRLKVNLEDTLTVPNHNLVLLFYQVDKRGPIKSSKEFTFALKWPRKTFGVAHAEARCSRLAILAANNIVTEGEHHTIFLVDLTTMVSEISQKYHGTPCIMGPHPPLHLRALKDTRNSKAWTRTVGKYHGKCLRYIRIVNLLPGPGP